MTRPIELVIFDCDGVLVDSERLAVRIDVRVLAALGWPLSERGVVDRFLGRSDEFMVAEVEAHLGRRLPADWEDEFQHRRGARPDHACFASGLTPAEHLRGPGTLVFSDMRDLPSLLARDPRP